MAHFLQQQDGNTLFEELAQTSACSAQAIVQCAFGHSSRDLDMVVHGDDFIIAGGGWLSQGLNEKLELVQEARLATTVRQLC